MCKQHFDSNVVVVSEIGIAPTCLNLVPMWQITTATILQMSKTCYIQHHAHIKVYTADSMLQDTPVLAMTASFPASTTCSTPHLMYKSIPVGNLPHSPSHMSQKHTSVKNPHAHLQAKTEHCPISCDCCHQYSIASEFSASWYAVYQFCTVPGTVSTWTPSFKHFQHT